MRTGFSELRLLWQFSKINGQWNRPRLKCLEIVLYGHMGPHQPGSAEIAEAPIVRLKRDVATKPSQRGFPVVSPDLYNSQLQKESSREGFWWSGLPRSPFPSLRKNKHKSCHCRTQAHTRPLCGRWLVAGRRARRRVPPESPSCPWRPVP